MKVTLRSQLCARGLSSVAYLFLSVCAANNEQRVRRSCESTVAPHCPLRHGHCQGRVPRMLTAERLLSGKL